MYYFIGEYKGFYSNFVEVFRKVDFVDFLLGIVKNGVSCLFIKEVREMILNVGFYKILMRFIFI